MANAQVVVVDNLALIPLTQTEVANLNLQALGVITIASAVGGAGDMSKAVFATINPSAGYVDKAVTATQVPYSGLTSLPGGTVNFLRADGTFATPPGQTYNIVSIGAAGLAPSLPPSSGFNFYLRGDGQWIAISTLSIGYSQLTGVPATFAPSIHATTHITSGQDLIPQSSTTLPGLVPTRPASGQTSLFHRADNTWSAIPGVTPSASGLIPQFPNNALAFFNGAGTYTIPTYAGLSGLPSTFAPSAHASTHITSGQDLIPNFAAGGPTPGLTPGSPGGTTLFLCADGTWKAPTGSGGLATSSAAGLMSQLPPTNQNTYYWGGDNLPHLISTLSLTYSQITGVPIFAGSSAGLVPNSAGGTLNFLRADGVYAVPPGSVVTTTSIGAVAQLPASSGATFYLNGLNVWTALSTITISYSQITSGAPTSLPPTPHALTHVTGGTDLIGPATTARNGLVPILPSVTPTLQYLNGLGNFAVIPTATGTNGGLVPLPTNSQFQWFRADATFQTINLATATQPGFVPAIPGNANVFLNGSLGYTSVDYTNGVSGKPATFAPSGHASSHVTGGGDQIPVFTSTATGLVPIAGAAGTYLGSNGLWSAPAGAGDVLQTFVVGTSGSLQGGGPLTGTSLTLSLANDQTTPAALSYYGTNSGGTRGWYTSVSQPIAVTGTPGLVPTPPGGTGTASVFLSGTATFTTPPTFTATSPGYAPSSAGGTVHFLRADGTWQTPPVPGLATTVAGGLVPSLLAVAQQPLAYLRGDDTWQLVSTLSIAYAQITGVPVFSGTTTNGLVPGATAGSASSFLRGDGVFAVPPLAASAVPGYIAGLPSASGFNFWARGDNSWQILPNFAIVASPWTMPPIGSPVSGVLVNSTTGIVAGMTVLTGAVGNQCFMEVTTVTDSTHLVLTNRGYSINPVPGTSITGGLLEIVGPSIAGAGIAGFVPTPTGLSTDFLNGAGQWATPPGAGGLTSVLTSNSIVGTGVTGDPIQLFNDTPTPGAFKFYSTDALGNLGWFPLISSWETSAPFVMPGIGGTQNISLVTNAEVNVGTTLAIEDNSIPSHQAFLEVISVNGDGIHIVVNNRGYAFNSPGGAPFASNAAVTLAGPGVAANGIPGFVPPSANNTVSFLRADGQFQVPANVSVGLPGYAPSAPGDPTFFLNGVGNYSIPTITALATTNTPGAVTGLLASGQSTAYLAGTNAWLPTSAISSQIDYTLIPNKPTSLAPTPHHASHISTGSDPIDLFSTSTTTSGLVPGSNNVGSTFFLNATGSWSTPPSGPGLATAGNPGLVAGLIASPTLQYLRGDNSWQAISSLSINYTQLTGTVPFAAVTHGSTHLDSAGGGTDPIPVVAGTRTGLVPKLPTTGTPASQFLAGDANWKVIPNVTSTTPGLVIPFDNNNLHFYRGDNSFAVIPALAIGTPGLVAALPATNGAGTWLRGDGNWANIPFYWTISASFIQPAISSPVTVTFLSTTFLKANMVIATVDVSAVTNIYSVVSITDLTHAVLQNLGCPGNTAAASTVNAGQVNQSGPPIMTGTSAGIVPIPHNLSTEFLCGNGSWAVPPTTGVPLTRNVSTQYSLTGGGALSSDLTLNLSGDTATPSAFQLYGTDIGANRGWQSFTSLPTATLSNPGLLITLSGSTSNFLRADGSWSAPAGLALASNAAAGIVPPLPAVPPLTPTTMQWLRADNSWQFLPDSNTTTASFQMPAVGTTVFPVTFNSTAAWDVGMTLFFATGNGATCCYMEVTTVNGDGVSLTLANRGYQTNPSPGTTIPTCLVFVVSPGTAKVVSGTGYAGLCPPLSNIATQFLNGVGGFTSVPTFAGGPIGLVPVNPGNNNTFFLNATGNWSVPASGGGGASTTTAGSTWTWPAAGVTTASIQLVSTSLMIVGSSIYAPTFGLLEVTFITDGTHATFRNNGNVGNATSGTVSIGTTLYVEGSGAKATATASGLLPLPPNDATKVLLGDATFGTLAYSSLSGTPTTPPAHASSHVTGGSDVIGPATSSVSGLVPVLSTSNPTNRWLRGDNAWVSGPPLAITTVAFTWPASGGTVVVTVDSTSLMRQNMALYATGLGICEVTNIGGGTTMTIRNNNNTGNAGSTASQTPAFYVGGAGVSATSTSSGVVSPDGTTTHFFNGSGAFSTPPNVGTGGPGYAPTAPGNAAMFLNGSLGTFTVPPTATSSSAGYVSPPNNTYQFLRGDANWANAGYVTTFTGFTVPAINVTVNVTVATVTDFVVGQTHLLTDGTLWMIGRVTTIASLVITYTNQGGGGSVSGSMGAGRAYFASAPAAINNSTTQFLRGDATFATPPSANATTAAGYVPTPPNNTYQYLRGDATFVTTPLSTVTTASFTQVAIGSNTASIAVESSGWMSAGMVLIVGTGSTWNWMSVVSKADTTHCVLTNIQGTTVSGTIASGAQIFESTIPIASATNAGIVPIPPNNTYQFLNGQAAWVTPCVTYARFKPYDNIPFSTTFPAFSTRGSYGLPVLDCADAVTTDCLFSDVMPANANLGSGLTVVIKWTAHTATSGAVRWQAAFGRLNASIASATFDTAGLVTSTTSGTIDTIATATISALTTINGITSGDLYVVKVSRLGADGADTMTDTAELCSVEIRSAGT